MKWRRTKGGPGCVGPPSPELLMNSWSLISVLGGIESAGEEFVGRHTGARAFPMGSNQRHMNLHANCGKHVTLEHSYIYAMYIGAPLKLKRPLGTEVETWGSSLLHSHPGNTPASLVVSFPPLARTCPACGALMARAINSSAFSCLYNHHGSLKAIEGLCYQRGSGMET